MPPENLKYKAVLAEMLAVLFKGRVTYLCDRNPDGFYFCSDTDEARYLLFAETLYAIKEEVLKQYTSTFQTFGQRIECLLVHQNTGKTYIGEYGWECPEKAKLMAFLHACTLIEQTSGIE